MKNLWLNVSFLCLAPILSFCSSFKDISISLYDKQKIQSKAVADAAKWSRSIALRRKYLNIIDVKDTLWLIERIDEVDKKVETYMWDSKRTNVIKYGQKTRSKSVVILYSQFDDPLKQITEELDSLSIKKKTSYMGAYRVFISRIINNDIQTFYFSDITPIQYFKEEY